MNARAWIVRHGFWFLAFIWLPAGFVAQAAIRFAESPGLFADSGEVFAALGSLALVAPCGLPLALACRCLWHLGYRRAAWVTGVALGIPTVAGAVLAGLLGPVAVAAWAVLLGLPVWIAWCWLKWRR